VAITVNNSLTSITAAEHYNIPIPAIIPTNMTIAVKPASNSQDKFWLAQVTGLKSETPLAYSLRYYQFNKAKKCWNLMKGQGGYGWVPHSAIMAAGIEFNNDKSMKASSTKMISNKLAQD
jgi:hypothetical protein